MIVISKKLFCLILVGLATLAVASVCSILDLPIDQASIAFIVTWIALVGVFETGHFFESDLTRDATKQQ